MDWHKAGSTLNEHFGVMSRPILGWRLEKTVQVFTSTIAPSKKAVVPLSPLSIHTAQPRSTLPPSALFPLSLSQLPAQSKTSLRSLCVHRGRVKFLGVKVLLQINSQLFPQRLQVSQILGILSLILHLRLDTYIHPIKSVFLFVSLDLKPRVYKGRVKGDDVPSKIRTAVG